MRYWCSWLRKYRWERQRREKIFSFLEKKMFILFSLSCKIQIPFIREYLYLRTDVDEKTVKEKMFHLFFSHCVSHRLFPSLKKRWSLKGPWSLLQEGLWSFVDSSLSEMHVPESGTSIPCTWSTKRSDLTSRPLKAGDEGLKSGSKLQRQVLALGKGPPIPVRRKDPTGSWLPSVFE